MEQNLFLIHKTKTLSNVFEILDELSFKCFYSLEHIREENFIESSVLDIAIPMISFSDINFPSKLNDEYGHYAFVMKKEWAVKNGITPVLYLEKKSDGMRLLNSIEYLISRMLNLTRENDLPLSKTVKDLQKYFISYLQFIKNYKHEDWKEKKLEPNYCFYEEREWRYVPIDENDCSFVKFIHKEKDYDREKEMLNRKANQYVLNFTLDDLAYLILDKEQDKSLLEVFFKNHDRDYETLENKILFFDELN